VVGLLDVMI